MDVLDRLVELALLSGAVDTRCVFQGDWKIKDADQQQGHAQLHIVVADLLAGAEQMGGKVKQGKRVEGAVKVIGALDNYGKYFDDAGFQPIPH